MPENTRSALHINTNRTLEDRIGLARDWSSSRIGARASGTLNAALLPRYGVDPAPSQTKT